MTTTTLGIWMVACLLFVPPALAANDGLFGLGVSTREARVVSGGPLFGLQSTRQATAKLQPVAVVKPRPVVVPAEVLKPAATVKQSLQVQPQQICVGGQCYPIQQATRPRLFRRWR